MIADPSASFTVGNVKLAPGFVHVSGFRRGQFGAIQEPTPSLQSTRLRWRSATALSRASEGVSLDRSQDPMPSLQLETFFW